jgi:DNA-binding beta-propeller fold protein YncE
MTTSRSITALVAAGGVLGSLLAGGATGTAAHRRAGSPALAMTGPYAYNVAVDATAGHAFVLSASTDNMDISGSPAGQGYLSMLDARTGRLLRTVQVGMGSYALGMDERTAHLFVANQGSSSTGQGRISMIDTRTGNVLRAIPLGQPRFMSAASALDLAVASRVGRLFVATARTPDQGILQVLDTRTGTLLRTVPRRTMPSFGVVPGAQMAVDQAAARDFLAPFPTGSRHL